MKRINRLFCALFFFIPLTLSADIFQGTFSQDDQTQGVFFTVNAPAVVTIQSYGYAGGTVGPTTIAEGGFDPDAFVFDSAGNLYAEYDGSSCVTGSDSVTGNCDDPYIQQSFAAGQYELVIVVSNNQPNDTFLGDGFLEDGAGPFTCAPFGETGNFCDVSTATGVQRTGNWAFDISGADSTALATTPEPGALSLLGGVCAALLLRRRQRKSQTSGERRREESRRDRRRIA
jgi:hypothetical protein